MATRRGILGYLALGLGIAACKGGIAQAAEQAVYVGIETSEKSGISRTAFFTSSGERLPPVALDYRAHGMARHRSHLVVFPRRPGNRFAVVDLETLDVRAVTTAPRDRHFYGHGAFSHDGRYLLVAENNLRTLQGSIGLYEMAGSPKRLGHFDLPGAGPHEIIRDRAADRFYIALGGLETHPEYGRLILNQSEFRSQVVVLTLGTSVVEPMGVWSGASGVSLRHMAQDGQGRLYIGGQIADPIRARSDHVLWLIDGETVQRVPVEARLGGYVSSVAANGATSIVTSKETHTAL
ncbi:MAG: DUF1513 domain-containing protein, partial [Pseudomonadota bacterium]